MHQVLHIYLVHKEEHLTHLDTDLGHWEITGTSKLRWRQRSLLKERDNRKRLLTKIHEALFRHEEWNIGIVNEPIAAFLRTRRTSSISWFRPPGHGKFLADPFGIQRDDDLYILCEEYDHSSLRGRIVGMRLDPDEKPSSARRIEVDLPVKTHASYPYLLEYENEIYCIPETYHKREVAVYRAYDFPRKWTKHATLIENFPGLDSTVFHFQNRWWLACTNEEDSPLSKLFIWYASHLFGPWSPHSANPVKKDITSARPAGTPFIHNGWLIRPAQDCSVTYGGEVTLNQVKKLTPTEFEEVEIGRVSPDPGCPYPYGVHTISAVGDFTLLDSKRILFIRERFIKELKQGVQLIIPSMTERGSTVRHRTKP